MAYWICITTEENWEVIRDKKIWGVAKRHEGTLRKVKRGDRLLIYVKQKVEDKKIVEPRIVGAFEVESEVFHDSTRIFKSPYNEVYPLRVKIKELKLGKVDFKPLIPKLKFIKNKSKWTGHLMGKAMREIPEEDYKLIYSLL